MEQRKAEGTESSRGKKRKHNHPAKTELRNIFQQLSQQRSTGLSKRQAESVVQLHEHVSIRRQMELFHMVEIHDRIAMHAEKTIRIELRLEVFQALPNQMRCLPHMQSNVIPRRLHPSDIVDFYNYDRFIFFNCQSLQKARRQSFVAGGHSTSPQRRLSIRAPAIRNLAKIQGSLEALGIKWFYKKVDSGRGKGGQLTDES